MNSGIYKIVNKINGKYYVGKSRNIKKRWGEHKRLLNKNIHDNMRLQNAWNKDGADTFEFVVVEYTEPNDTLLTETEQKYLDKFVEDKKNGIDNCYNIAITSDLSVHSEETRKKMSDSLKGKMAGEKNPMYGKPRSQETRQKISRSLKGKYFHKKSSSADKTIYTWKNIITNETYTGTRCNFRKVYNVSKDSTTGLINKRYSRTKTGWTLQEKHSDQSFPQPL